MFEDYRNAFFIPQGKAGCAEIQQPAFPPGGDENIVRANVPVQQVHGVHLGKGFHDGL